MAELEEKVVQSIVGTGSVPVRKLVQTLENQGVAERATRVTVQKMLQRGSLRLDSEMRLVLAAEQDNR